MTTKQLLLIALAVTITFVQEQMLMILPNVQLTVVLIIVFTSVFTFRQSMIYILVYVILDNLFMGGFNLFYMIPMFLAWSLIPISYHTILKRTNNEMNLALFAFIFGFVYGWVYIPFNMIQMGITNVYPYLMADILFEVVMAVAGFLTVLWLYKPLHRVVKTFVDTSNYETVKTFN